MNPCSIKSSYEEWPDLLLSFLCSSSVISGQWIYTGTFQPKASYNLLYFGEDDKYSLPLTIWVIPIRWSSTTLAKLYVGYPSDLIRIISSSSALSTVIAPYISSLKVVVPVVGLFCLITYGIPASSFAWISSLVKERQCLS